jgi:hypothetical protein
MRAGTGLRGCRVLVDELPESARPSVQAYRDKVQNIGCSGARRGRQVTSLPLRLRPSGTSRPDEARIAAAPAARADHPWRKRRRGRRRESFRLGAGAPASMSSVRRVVVGIAARVVAARVGGGSIAASNAPAPVPAAPHADIPPWPLAAPPLAPASEAPPEPPEDGSSEINPQACTCASAMSTPTYAARLPQITSGAGALRGRSEWHPSRGRHF